MCAQEDPRRFQDVVKWKLTSTQTAHGSADDGDIHATWNQSGQFTAELTPGSMPWIPWGDASWRAENSAAGSMSLLNVWSMPTLVFTMKDDGFIGGNPQVTMNFVDKTYTLYFPVLFKTLIQEVPVPGGGTWTADGAITNALPATGLSLSGQISWPILDAIRANAAPTSMPFPGTTVFQGDLTVTWTLEPEVEEVELVVDPNRYDEWKPEGNLATPEKFGNFILLTAKLQKVGGGTPQNKATSFKFELVDVSKEPGVCMNFPITSPSTGRDFKFEQEVNDTIVLDPYIRIVSETVGEVIDPLAQATGKGNLVSAGAVVSAFDFGAYGTIKVTAKVNAREIVGYWKDDPQKERGPIRLPKREADSHIADKWKEKVSQLPDDDDEENQPVGDGHKGDGYSLYEEYRGFSENRKHKRLDPLKKDLFILDGIGDGKTKQQIGQFARLSNLKVRHELAKDEMTDFNVMNINHGGNPAHLHDQTGLRVVLGKKHLGYSEAALAEGQLNNSTPGAHTEIRIDPGPSFGLDLSGGNEEFPGAPSYISIAHELAHGCSVWHHGDKDDQYKSLRSVIVFNQGLSTLNGSPMFLHHENGSPFTRLVDSPKIYLARLQGQHSGHQDCIMRYNTAGLYTHMDRRLSTNSVTGEVSNLFVFYKVESADPNAQSMLCINAAGTGVNAPKPNTVWPRYGDADTSARRGNCKGQVCVNDKYRDDPRHARE